jgi:hypothetical protein
LKFKKTNANIPQSIVQTSTSAQAANGTEERKQTLGSYLRDLKAKNGGELPRKKDNSTYLDTIMKKPQVPIPIEGMKPFKIVPRAKRTIRNGRDLS